MGSVSEPEYVNRRPADQQPNWLDALPAYPGSAGQRSPRPRIGKESGDTEDVVYGQVRVPTQITVISYIKQFKKAVSSNSLPVSLKIIKIFQIYQGMTIRQHKRIFLQLSAL